MTVREGVRLPSRRFLLEPTSGAKAKFNGIDDRVGAAPTLDPHKTFRLQMRRSPSAPCAKARGKRFAGRETLAGRECAACNILGKGVADLSPQTDARPFNPVGLSFFSPRRQNARPK